MKGFRGLSCFSAGAGVRKSRSTAAIADFEQGYKRQACIFQFLFLSFHPHFVTSGPDIMTTLLCIHPEHKLRIQICES